MDLAMPLTMQSALDAWGGPSRAVMKHSIVMTDSTTGSILSPVDNTFAASHLSMAAHLPEVLHLTEITYLSEAAHL